MTTTIDSALLRSPAAREKTVQDLTYNAYAWQRSFYGIAAERLEPHFPLADKYEARYQEALARRACSPAA